MRDADATVTVVVGDRIALDQTVFYARSGGRPSEHGSISAFGCSSAEIVAHALDWLAVAAYEQGDLATAHAAWLESLEIRRRVGDRAELADTLEGFAGLAVHRGQPERALRLAGAAAAQRAAAGRRLAVEHARLDRWLVPAREALTMTAQAAAWARGRAMSPDEAAAFALEDLPG